MSLNSRLISSTRHRLLQTPATPLKAQEEILFVKGPDAQVNAYGASRLASARPLGGETAGVTAHTSIV
jgi:hypothetical protein